MATMLALMLLAMPAAGTIWIEGESPVTTNVKPGLGAPGRPEWLSSGRWLTVTGSVPEEGASLAYAFTGGGRRELWHRVGFEAARSPYEWRVDGGEWHRVEPTTPTLDLMELVDWNGVAWMDLGAVDLRAGGHRLEIRIPKPAKGDVLYGSDAFALADGPFHPNGKWKPGEVPRTDRDLAAAERTFAVADRAGPERQTIRLDGDWEIARDDELRPALVATPMAPLDPNPVWSAIAVPGDKAARRPDLGLAHRVWYRTRFAAPQGARSYALTFRQNSLNTTVIVNGKLCGFNKNPFVKWSCDVTAAVHAGTNEVLVGIRDAWYGFHQDPNDPAALWREFAFPASRDHQGFLRLDYPVWGCFKSGLLDTPELTVAGPSHATDVFVRPSVAAGRLDADVTLRGQGPATVVVEAVDPNTGKVAKEIARRDLALEGEATVTLGGPWADSVLWWPDRPKTYLLRTTILQNGKPVDVGDTPFGFREWTVAGKEYRLNGVVWHGWAELVQGATPEAWLANYRRTGQRFQRMSGPAQNGGGIEWLGMPYDAALDWCDRNGVVIRRCGPLDGEAIGYMAIDEKGGINAPLLANVRDQIAAQVRGERNHPSVNVWSVENEWLYINALNLYGGLMDAFEADMAKTVEAVRAVDPTRLAMTDGGGAGKAQLLPVHGDHYVYTNDPADYPGLAYTTQPNGGGRGRWTYDGKRPRYVGEDYFASGINPADYAWIQGEGAFGGKAAARRGMAEVQRMITEGYRWGGGFTAFHLWIGDEGAEYPDKYAANAERAAFVRQRDAAFTGGTSTRRTLAVLNDSRSAAPLTLSWSLTVGGKPVAKGTRTLAVAPGTKTTLDVPLAFPKVAVRTAGTFALDLRAEGRSVFHDAKPLAVLPEPPVPSLLALYDPGGIVARYLAGRKVAFRPVRSLAALPADAPTLVVGPDALTEADATDPVLAAYAADGHRVVVLEQKNPLRGAGLPTDLEPAEGGGAFGFAEDATHSILRGLDDADLRGWADGDRLYERPYRKATRGVRSFIEVGPRLSQTALCEVPVGRGVLLLSQVRVGHGLAAGGPARTLLANLVGYAAGYRHVERAVLTSVADPELAKALDATGVRRTEVADPLATLKGDGVAVVSATPANLRTLAANLPRLRAFTANGGDLVLHGLTPEGLADYDRIVGVEHLIRPFRQEKTALAVPRDPLATGMAQGDVAMSSGEKMFPYNDDTFVASDVFSYVVDTGDVAPFAKLPGDYLYNAVNGLVSSDSWKYVLSFDLKGGAKPELAMAFPKPLTFRELTWIGNGFYHKATKIGLSFDGGPPVTFVVQPNTDPQTLRIAPARTAKTIRLEILDWTREPGVGDVVGIDNVYLQTDRPAGWPAKVRPLLNVGGIVRYPQGKGAVVLANLLFKARETVPENALKKRSLLATVLRNLGAGFSGGASVVVPGAHGLTYTPVTLAGKANAFRNAFGEGGKTLAAVPTGRQTFGSVPFEVYDFPTSPVPNAVALGPAERVEAIPVGGKASALFFLHAARVERPLGRGEKPVEVARYVVAYADGTVVRVPVELGLDLDDFRQPAPRDLPRARVAWSRPFAGGGDSATLYLMQWTNPRPEVVVASVGLEYGAQRRAVPVLIAVTGAR